MEDKIRWWGLSIHLDWSQEEMELNVDHFLRNIPNLTQSKTVVWKASLYDLLGDKKESQETVSMVVKEETKPDGKRNLMAFFVDGKMRLLFLEWLFTHNRFRGFANREEAFDVWKQNVWNDYAMSVTAGNTTEMMTFSLKQKLSDRYHKLMNLTIKDFEDYFEKRFHRLGSNQICSKSFEEERKFPYNPLVCGPRSNLLDEGESFSKPPSLKRSLTAPPLMRKEKKLEPTPIRKKAKTVVLKRMMTSFDFNNMQQNVIG